MPDLIPSAFDTLEAAPDGLRPFLVQLDEKFGKKFVVNINPDLDPRVAPLKNAYERVNAEKKALGDQVKAFGDVTPEKVAELTAALEAKSSKVVDVDQRIKDVSEKASLEIKALQAQIATEKGTIDQLVRHTAIQSALNKIPGASEVLLMPHVLTQTATTLGADGKPIVTVIDPTTKAARIKDHLGSPMSVEDLLNEMAAKPEFGGAFPGKIPNGSGAKTTTTTVGGPKTIPGGDNQAFLDNLAGIAKGETKMQSA